MNSYESKQEARRQRYLDRAEKAHKEAEAGFERASKMAEIIPMGQPILVGHHSEKRDRNYRNRIQDTARRALEAEKKAKYYESKAASVGCGGISSDDPDAVEKLHAELAQLEEAQRMMKEINRTIRKHKTTEERFAAIVALGYSEKTARNAVTPDCMGGIGFAHYSLSNNNANIRRIKARIAELEQAAMRPTREEEGNGYTYREDTEENRVMFFFPGKPSEEIRQILKTNAFKWSPSRGAWVRQMTGRALYSASVVKKLLGELEA